MNPFKNYPPALDELDASIHKMPWDIDCCICHNKFPKYGMTWKMSKADGKITGPYCGTCSKDYDSAPE